MKKKKQVELFKPYTEAEEREAWKKPQRHAEPTANFDKAHLYAKDEGIDADAVSHGATRDEVEAVLQRLGLKPNERAVVLAVHCDRLDTQAAIAGATKLNRKTVAAILRRGDVRDALHRLRRGEPLQAASPPVAVKRDWRRLDGEMKRAKHWLSQYTKPEQWTDSIMKLYEPERAAVAESATASLAEKRLVLIGLCPRVLQHPEHGAELLAALVETMEAARFGNKSKAAVARKALRWLVVAARGNPVGFGDILLGQILYGLALAFAPIHRAAQGERGGAAAMVIRRTFGAELDCFKSDAELLPLLKVELTAAAARLAEKATGINAEAYLRAWTHCPYLRTRLAERLRE